MRLAKLMEKNYKKKAISLNNTSSTKLQMQRRASMSKHDRKIFYENKKKGIVSSLNLVDSEEDANNVSATPHLHGTSHYEKEKIAKKKSHGKGADK